MMLSMRAEGLEAGPSFQKLYHLHLHLVEAPGADAVLPLHLAGPRRHMCPRHWSSQPRATCAGGAACSGGAPRPARLRSRKPGMVILARAGSSRCEASSSQRRTWAVPAAARASRHLAAREVGVPGQWRMLCGGSVSIAAMRTPP